MPADPQPECIEVRMGHSWANDAMGRGKKIGEVIRRTKTNLTLRQTEAEWEEALDDAIWQVDIESDPSIPAEDRSLNARRSAERAVRGAAGHSTCEMGGQVRQCDARVDAPHPLNVQQRRFRWPYSHGP